MTASPHFGPARNVSVHTLCQRPRRPKNLLGELCITAGSVDALALRDGSGHRRVIAGIADFQEHLGGELTVTLLAAIGHGVEVHTMDEELIERAIEWLKGRGR